MTRTCTKCGEPLAPQDRFCGECGAAVEERPQEAQSPAQPVSATPKGETGNVGWGGYWLCILILALAYYLVFLLTWNPLRLLHALEESAEILIPLWVGNIFFSDVYDPVVWILLPLLVGLPLFMIAKRKFARWRFPRSYTFIAMAILGSLAYFPLFGSEGRHLWGSILYLGPDAASVQIAESVTLAVVTVLVTVLVARVRSQRRHGSDETRS